MNVLDSASCIDIFWYRQRPLRRVDAICPIIPSAILDAITTACYYTRCLYPSSKTPGHVEARSHTAKPWCSVLADIGPKTSHWHVTDESKMKQLASRITYGSKVRSHQQRRTSITKSRIHLSKLRKLTLSAALTELWIGIAIEWRQDDTVDIAFASNTGRLNPEFVVHSLRIPQQPKTSLDSLFSEPEDAGSLICDYIVDAVRLFQGRNKYKYLGAGLSQEVVKMSPQLPAKLWLDLDIVPITTRLDPDSVSSHWSDVSSESTSRSNSRAAITSRLGSDSVSSPWSDIASESTSRSNSRGA